MPMQIAEIFDLAVELEREGEAYYEELSSLTENKAAKEIFQELAEDEHRHELFFIGLKNDYPYGDDILEDATLEDMVRNVRLYEIFPDMYDEKVAKIHMLSAIKVGIKAEKRSVKLYKQLAKHVKSKSALSVLKQFIEEEKTHVQRLTELHKNKTFDF